MTTKPKELTVGSLFTGIGGLDLGLERAGMRVVWQCEIDPYCRRVLEKHWPGVKCYEDIQEMHGLPVGSVRSGAKLSTAAWPVDLICGGFPCQPVSLAGKGLAQKDPRWLWPEFARVVGELRPRYVLVENVPGLVRRGLSDVVGDLAAMGYDAEWQIVSAASVGAPHLRERILLVAYANDEAQHALPVNAEVGGTPPASGAHPGGNGILADTSGVGSAVGREAGDLAGSPGAPKENGEQRQRGGDASDHCGPDVADANSFGRLRWTGNVTEANGRPELANGGWWLSEPAVGRVADGVPARVDRLRALGNAVVPQVAEFVGRLILEYENTKPEVAA